MLPLVASCYRAWMDSTRAQAVADNAVTFFCQHLVAIALVVEDESGNRQADAYTCFVLEVRGVWVLATAGHVVERLDAILASAKLKVVECSLYDGWSGRHGGGDAKVPFNLSDAVRVGIDDDRQGIDVGLIGVPPLVRRTLEANGIVALSERTWRNVPDDLEVHFIIGLPQELIENIKAGDRLTHLAFEPVLVRVVACDAPAVMAKPTRRFYGKIPGALEDGGISDIEGMSGGPIIGMRSRDGELRYFLVAIQSGWRKDLQVIAGNYAVAVADSLEREMDAATKGAEG